MTTRCEGRSNDYGCGCPYCPRFMDDCDGHPDYEFVDGNWVESDTMEGD